MHAGTHAHARTPARTLASTRTTRLSVEDRPEEHPLLFRRQELLRRYQALDSPLADRRPEVGRAPQETADRIDGNRIELEKRGDRVFHGPCLTLERHDIVAEGHHDALKSQTCAVVEHSHELGRPSDRRWRHIGRSHEPHVQPGAESGKIQDDKEEKSSDKDFRLHCWVPPSELTTVNQRSPRSALDNDEANSETRSEDVDPSDL